MKKKLSLIFITAFLAVSSYGQGVICDPITYPQCANCMIIDIENNTGCDMNFFWEYSYNGCSQFAYAGFAAGPGTTQLVGKCIAFCDGPCQCPSWLRIGEWGGAPGFLPWTCSLVFPFSAPAFVDCNGFVVSASTTIIGPNHIKLTFTP